MSFAEYLAKIGAQIQSKDPIVEKCFKRPVPNLTISDLDALLSYQVIWNWSIPSFTLDC